MHDLRGLDSPSIVTVRYEVNQRQYEISETVKRKNEFVKLGPVSIGQIKSPAMESAQKGAKVLVRYRLDDPGLAILEKNEGTLVG